MYGRTLYGRKPYASFNEIVSGVTPKPSSRGYIFGMARKPILAASPFATMLAIRARESEVKKREKK